MRDAGYKAEIVPSGRYSALSPANICNKGRSGRGAQLELARDLRIILRNSPDELANFAQTIATAIDARGN
jgi:phage replication-related protein YjqB (UPF0714/DUF867 family)